MRLVMCFSRSYARNTEVTSSYGNNGRVADCKRKTTLDAAHAALVADTRFEQRDSSAAVGMTKKGGCFLYLSKLHARNRFLLPDFFPVDIAAGGGGAGLRALDIRDAFGGEALAELGTIATSTGRATSTPIATVGAIGLWRTIDDDIYRIRARDIAGGQTTIGAGDGVGTIDGGFFA